MKPSNELIDKCVVAAMRKRDEVIEEVGFFAVKSVVAIQRAMIVAAIECYEREI